MNILITRHDKIGDFITTLPLFYVVKKANPSAKIYALVSRINVELANQIDFIDEVILYDKNNFWQTLKAIKNADIEVSISAFIDTQLGWILFLSRIKIRIAPATKLAQVFFNKTLRQRRSLVEKNEVMYNLDLAKLLNQAIDLNYKVPLLKLENKQYFRNKHQLQDKQLVLFHPGYGGSSDGNLTLKEYIELADTVRGKDNAQIIWTFGPDDISTKNQLQAKINKKDIIYQPKTLLDFCNLINDSLLIISTSTGPMHLAGALNIQTIGFFGDNLFASPKRWATVNDSSKQHNFILNKHLKLTSVKQIIMKILC
ncbi:glycosyltransferase family 9 protein [Bathymodiolus thermophilus thioautotrophic gill symbiont]|uniref:ADP-heptose--lipooligosaccharide heptosyltransferase II n=1 Tax=Bathymodiolus thermophilus thioautotrophic gill symbiont TaxID=2360 RepID=A0A8H9CF11_9GAMM|nr:glycosyltransferase family 9 protein [Bathymodiolus thermophilus thioautotrophic gill symbiont]CAB5494003.1 ADP-heptose--lipooligosaccharide heptosyltransferase II [Bathymodiolus thermophilus thioautotrophic gill symbiont]